MSITNTTVEKALMLSLSNGDADINNADDNARDNTAHEITDIASKPYAVTTDADGNAMINIITLATTRHIKITESPQSRTKSERAQIASQR